MSAQGYELIGGPRDGELIALPPHKPQVLDLTGWDAERGALWWGEYRWNGKLADRGKLHWFPSP